MITLPYDKDDIQKFGHLLTLIMSDTQKTEENVRILIPNSKQFDIIHIINDHYHSFSIVNGYYRLTSKGVEIQRIGLKEYYYKLQIDQQLDLKIKEHTLAEFNKTEKRFQHSIKKSNAAILISIILPILILIGEKYFIAKISNDPKNTYDNSEIGLKINHPIPISDTIFIKSLGNSKNKFIHNFDSLNFKLIIKKE